MNFCAFIFVLFLFNHKTIGMQEIVVSEHIWCPTENFNYRLIDGECFYYETVKKHSLQIAQENCAGKFPNGGKLFEPRTLVMNAIVLKGSEHIIAPDIRAWFYLGIRRETVESEYKFLSDGKSLNFTLPWWPGSPNNNKNEFCCFANHNSLWDDNVCIGNDWYSICESNLK